MKQSIKQNGQNLIYPKTANWTIIYGSHNEIKSHQILSPHSFNPPLSIIIPLPYHSSNEMRSLPASSRIAVIEANNQSSSSNPAVSIPPCKPAFASLNQESVCHRAIEFRWIIHSKQQKQTLPSFIPSLLYDFQSGIQGFIIHTHIVPLQILSTSHTL